MGDNNFDPCECIWNHELSMRRLLSFLRNTQSYCTDTECFIEDPSTGSNAIADQGVFFMSLFFVFAMFMYFMRPNGQRIVNQDTSKPQNKDGSNDMPPRPPPTSS